jgi:inner membrane protein
VDNLTHVLSGALLGAVTTPDAPDARSLPTRSRVLLAVVATNAPDLDYLTAFLSDPLTVLNLHRGITHSVVMAPLWGVLVAGVAHLVTRRRHRFAELWLLATLALLFHCALDSLTSYGTQLFAPLSSAPYAFPVLFIIDPLCWLILGTACALAWRRGSLAVARAGLAALVGYVVLASGLMLWAERAAIGYSQSVGAGRTVLALPQPLSPTHWKLVVIDGDTYHTAYLSLLGGARAAAPDDAGFLARSWAGYQPATALHWVKRHRFGTDPPMRGFGRYAWTRDELGEFRRFALLPQLYAIIDRGGDAGCGWFADLRFETPARSPPFRVGICHGPVQGLLDRRIGWSLRLEDPPPLVQR